MIEQIMRLLQTLSVPLEIKPGLIEMTAQQKMLASRPKDMTLDTDAHLAVKR